LENIDQYNTYVTEDGMTVYIPKAFIENEQQENYQNFIIVLAGALMKYGTGVTANS